MSKYCQNCGAMLDDNARFCGSCGFMVAEFDENYQQMQYQQPTQILQDQAQQPTQILQDQAQQPTQMLQDQVQQATQILQEQAQHATQILQEQAQHATQILQEQAQQPIPVQQVQNGNYNQFYYQQQNIPVKPKKKSKKKPIIISVVAVVLVAALAFGGFTLYDKFFYNADKLKENGKFTVINMGGKNIYFALEPMVINDDGSISSIDVVYNTDEFDVKNIGAGYEKQFDLFNISRPYYSVYDGDAIYCKDTYGYFNKVTYNDGKLYVDTWIDGDKLSYNGLNYENRIFNFQSYGDYIYFNTYYNYDISSCKSVSKLGRISKDGKTFEILSDNIHAADYTISDGWIYYYNNGFNYNDKMNNRNYEISINDFSQDKVGIYRAKEDGSNVEKLFGDFKQGDKCAYFENFYRDLKVVDGYIYFIDYSNNGQGKICRINKDGSDYQQISNNSVYSYTFDYEQNVLYFITGQSNLNEENEEFTPKVYQKKLDGDNFEKELFELKDQECCLQYYNDYLYLNYYVSVLNDDMLSLENAGERYSLKNNKVEIAKGTQEKSLDKKTWKYSYSKAQYEWVDDFTK